LRKSLLTTDHFIKGGNTHVHSDVQAAYSQGIGRKEGIAWEKKEKK